MTLNDKLKSNILRDFDKRLQTELSMDLYSFIATVKLDEGDSFHDVVDVIFTRDGARGLREFLDLIIECGISFGIVCGSFCKCRQNF